MYRWQIAVIVVAVFLVLSLAVGLPLCFKSTAPVLSKIAVIVAVGVFLVSGLAIGMPLSFKSSSSDAATGAVGESEGEFKGVENGDDGDGSRRGEDRDQWVALTPDLNGSFAPALGDQQRR
jgi:hypothetical protein